MGACCSSSAEGERRGREDSGGSHGGGGDQPQQPQDVDSRVDINSCSLADLKALRGVGVKTAERIVAGRPWQRVEDAVNAQTRLKKHSHLLRVGSGGSSGGGGGCVSSGGVVTAEAVDTITVGSWNIRHLSAKRTAPELARIAEVLSRFDVVAVQEVHDVDVCERLLSLLNDRGSSYSASATRGQWRFRLSDKVGRGARNVLETRVYEERYCFFFDEARVRLVDGSPEPWLVNDDTDVLHREPFVGYFKAVAPPAASEGASGIDFVLCTVHVTFGSDKAARQAEMVSLGRMLSAIETAVAPERDILLVGDFNLGPHECPWWHGGDGEYVPLVKSPDTTTIYRSLYDNIWMPSLTRDQLVEASGVTLVDHEFFPDTSTADYKSTEATDARKQCNKELSDHRPVWVRLRNEDRDRAVEHGSVASLKEDLTLTAHNC